MDHGELTGRIIGCAMEVHSVLGPGLGKARRGSVSFTISKPADWRPRPSFCSLSSEGVRLDAGYRLDVLVENTVDLELKAVGELAPIHKAQLISYLKSGGFPVGILINFNVVHLRDGIKRVYPGIDRQPEDKVQGGSPQGPRRDRSD
jgi:GxxExxY protein